MGWIWICLWTNAGLGISTLRFTDAPSSATTPFATHHNISITSSTRACKALHTVLLYISAPRTHPNTSPHRTIYTIHWVSQSTSVIFIFCHHFLYLVKDFLVLFIPILPDHYLVLILGSVRCIIILVTKFPSEN